MRDFGFGRRCPSLEAMINEELNDLINLLKNGPVEKDENVSKWKVYKISNVSKNRTIIFLQLVCRDGLIMMPNIFFMAFINSFMAVFSRERWPRSKHHELIKLGRGAMVFQRAGDDMGRALSQTPWLRHIIPEMSGYNDLKRGNKVIYEFIEVIINKLIIKFV